MPGANPTPNLDAIDPSVAVRLASYLSQKDIQALQVTSKPFNTKFGANDVWKPLLSQLHAIDETISVEPQSDKTIKDAFIAGLEKVRIRQLAEIAYLRAQHSAQIFENCPHINKITPNQTLNISDVVAISAELDKLNSAIITSEIERAKISNPDQLVLSRKGITRFPEALIDHPAHKEFWRNLKDLDCSSNFLQILPRNIGYKMQELKELRCNFNQLTALPESIGELQELQQLYCSENQLTVLPESIGKLQWLRWLDCSNNQLTSLPESIYRLNIIHFRWTNNWFYLLKEELRHRGAQLQAFNQPVQTKLGEYWNSLKNSCINTFSMGMHNLSHDWPGRSTAAVTPENDADPARTEVQKPNQQESAQDAKRTVDSPRINLPEAVEQPIQNAPQDETLSLVSVRKRMKN